jgi:hypothetical protein
MIGGPGTPGLLVARRELFTNRVPDVPGGGTVRFVNPTEHDYLGDIEAREEGGTPAIVDSIRAGLVFQLKEAVGTEEIRRREHTFVRRAIESWDANPAIEILGNHESERLSIVSFVIRHDDQYLHHNLVVAVLNDLFGIQARGGCSCAGPYGHRLLGIDLDRSHEFEREVDRGCEGIKPGWTRVNVNYFIDEETFAYLLEAVHLVATDGWRLLPWYRFEPESGLWRHRDGPVDPPRSLRDISYADGVVSWPRPEAAMPAPTFEPYLDEARALLSAEAERPAPIAAPDVTADFEHLRWFWFPEDVPVS